MVRLLRSPLPAALAAMLLLAGCASRGIEAPVPIAEAAPPPPPPALPPGLAAGMPVPPVDADGAYRTINHGVGPAQAVWHVRSALNVAALACRGPEEAGIVAAYNALLKRQRTALANALKATEARYRAERGIGWRSAQDVDMTRVYNFFAQPPAQQRFCAVAEAVLAEAGTVAPDAFTGFAVASLPRLEAPFTDVYRGYDAYRRALAAWQARYGVAPPQLAMRGQPD